MIPEPLSRDQYAQSPFDNAKQIIDGEERWSARDLQTLMGYSNWQHFQPALQRAMASAAQQGMNVETVFTRSRKNPSTQGGRPSEDYLLTRFAAYLTAMNGDPNKPEVAAAQAYFAVRTRQAETQAPVNPDQLTRRDLARMVIDAEDAREVAEMRARELEPAARAWTTMAACHGDMSVDHAAKVLSRDAAISTGRNRLFASMADAGWIYRAGERHQWHAYQTQIDNGRLAHKLSGPFLNHRTGELEVPAPTIRITMKGLSALHRILGGTDELETLLTDEDVAA